MADAQILPEQPTQEEVSKFPEAPKEIPVAEDNTAKGGE